MNKDRLIHLCHKISKENNIPFNSILTYYFLEDILFHLLTADLKKTLFIRVDTYFLI